MNPAALDRAVLSGGLAQIAQRMGTYDSKTDQTAQTDQRIEDVRKFGAAPGQKLPNCHLKLTSGTVHQGHSRARGAPSATDRAQDAAAERAPRR